MHMLAFARDLPNCMTLAGLCCGMLAIYFASIKSYPAAMVALLPPPVGNPPRGEPP